MTKYSFETVKNLTGCGSAWLERLVWDQEVAGSNPVTPIKKEFSKLFKKLLTNEYNLI